ncbi:MAG: exopolysaccharide biosynthesis polyprenyl glycosylphosphotransferase [Kiritimatiellia bacterium]
MVAYRSLMRIRNTWLFQFIADFFAIVAAYYTTLLLRFHSEWGQKFFAFAQEAAGEAGRPSMEVDYELFYLTNAPRIIVLMTVTICFFYALRNMYPGRRFITKRPILWEITVANVAALAVFFVYFYVTANRFHPRSIFATALTLNIVYCAGFRKVTDGILRLARRAFREEQCRAVLAGFGEEAETIYELIRKRGPHGITVAERVASVSNVTREKGVGRGEAFEEFKTALGQAASRNGAEMVILADSGLEVSEIMRIMMLADKMDMAVKVLSHKLDAVTSRARMQADMIMGVPLVHFEPASRVRGPNRARRLIEAGIALAVMPAALPLMGLIAMVIKVTSRGPAFFFQERIGFEQQPFRIIKFRTMYERAVEEQAAVEEFNESGRGLFKIKKDPRVTPVGRLLRRFSLDELPQLINVIRGEMTIVGPRPLPKRDFENYYEDWHYLRHAGMPGLTCLWQVSGRSDIGFQNMCVLDIYYLRNQNWILDFKIVVRTAWVVLFAKGAY